MEDHPKDDAAVRIDQRPPLDPLRRVFIPIERRTKNGTIVFKTTDGELYMRHTDGSMRRVHKKVHGKAARKQRARMRHAQRT